MEYRRLNITVLSAQGLKDVNHFSKMDVYADVSIAGYPQSRQRTPIDKNSGTSPKWNHRMEFIVDEPYLTKPGLSLLFQIRTQSTFGPDKDIGSVTVPVHDLFTPASASADRTLDYQVVTPSGKPKGTLKFSYKFGEKFTHQPETKRAAEPVTAYPPPQYAYPPAQHPAGYGYGQGYPAAPPAGYGYGQGHAAAPPAGYGYAPAYAQPQRPKKNKMGMGGGLGLGLGAGLLGGLLVGDMASDIGESAAYADGYGDAMGDMGDFDF
ncbi:protein SRC2 homolog [Salvia miltiorrhiza]|uniref:protein SRC2 homolog n=1 Tax=Salvia miltiorrhiza TaxID=226208 RepID=UPI0025AC1A66|nr:protein SRC2 homolog [Salvia miltiorrhiza]